MNNMKTKRVWKNIECTGLEIAHIEMEEAGIKVCSTVMTLENHSPTCIEYTLRLNQNWEVENLEVSKKGQSGGLFLSVDKEGNWFLNDGTNIPDLTGAVDVDLSCTPLTNSLPIKRMDWEQQVEPAQIDVVYIDHENLTYKKVTQSYKRIHKREDTQTFHYKSGQFETVFTVDHEGFVLAYPTYFNQVYPHQTREEDLQ